MTDTILSLTTEKLKQALNHIDGEVQSKIRGTWTNVGPSPDCPYIGEVMKQIHALCADGHRKRGVIAKETVLGTLTPVRGKIKRRDYDDILAMAEELLLSNPYAALPGMTAGVYQRRQARKQKYESYNGEAELALIEAGSANLSRESVRSLKLALDEMRIQDALAKPHWWQRWIMPAWTHGLSPAIKWLFTLLAALIAVVVTAYLRGGH